MADPRWLEVSLVVDGELAEALSDLMARYVEGGVVIESGIKFNSIEDEGSPGGPVRVFGYIPVDDKLEATRQKLENGLWHLGQITPLPQPAYRPVEDQDWMSAWKKHYHPIPAGKKILILPAWIEQDPGERIVVRIDPSMAFGTGTHPTTQLCLEMVEEYCTPDMDVIDIGCGSGILSIAALKLGAKRALAMDIDPLSVKATRENAEANDVSESIETGSGSVLEVLNHQFSICQAPLVLANILAPVIIKMFSDGLLKLLLPGGILVLSGILEEQEPGVLHAAENNSLMLLDRKQMGSWVSLALQNNHPALY
ncbi:MAG: 50S ribosomal protein L11 methyltransferase [Anaerolinea sp.]|nr:50S ribosomal protein L11 methyltransferase [Anaerolinea sp.]